jgi:hypothetical protein
VSSILNYFVKLAANYLELSTSPWTGFKPRYIAKSGIFSTIELLILKGVTANLIKIIWVSKVVLNKVGHFAMSTN